MVPLLIPVATGSAAAALGSSLGDAERRSRVPGGRVRTAKRNLKAEAGDCDGRTQQIPYKARDSA